MYNPVTYKQVILYLLFIVIIVSLVLILSSLMRASDHDTQMTDDTARTGVTRNADWTNLVGNAGYRRDFDGITMVLVPTGCFRMGNDDSAYHWDGLSYSEGVPDGGEQCIDAPFWIDQTEVTQGDFVRLGGQADVPSFFEGDTRPQDRIIWQEAQDYCLSRGGRLPTEAEWEYVARGPDNLFFPWGNEWRPDNVVGNRTSEQGTAEVGTLMTGASWVGALDMSGNVWEWTSSVYAPYPYIESDTTEQQLNRGELASYAIRGGSWDGVNIGNLHASTRDEGFSGLRFNDFGFRCVRPYQPLR